MDAERIRRQMQEVAVGNYRAFIAAADALCSIREEVSAVDHYLESLVLDPFLDLNNSILGPGCWWVLGCSTSNKNLD